MFPDLWSSTNDYWRKLNGLEAAYQRGEVSLQEVNDTVAHLMAELEQERRTTFSALLSVLNQRWQEQKELFLGVSMLGALTYLWVVINQLT
ncbi:MAG: hypothetical protein WCA35_14100 [Kovacikia sp.]